MILIEVNGQSLFVKNPEIVAESVKYLKAAFSFTKDWDGYSKAAIFKAEDGEPMEVILEESSSLYAGDGAFFVPHEVIVAPHFYLSVVGNKDDSKITTEAIKIDVKEGGESEGVAPSEPTPDVFSQISEMCTVAMHEAMKMNEKADMLEEAGEEALKQISEDKEICEEARDICVEAKEKTQAARLALEDGTEWVFDGGDSVNAIEKIKKIQIGQEMLTLKAEESDSITVNFRNTFEKPPHLNVFVAGRSLITEPVTIAIKNLTISGFRAYFYCKQACDAIFYWTAIEK